MDEDVELMDVPAREMEARLNEVIQNGSDTKAETKYEPIDLIHAYMFVYDSSNKRTFDSMKCMLDTIMELEKSNKKSAGTRGGGGKKKGGKGGGSAYYPKKIVVGNKKDLKKNKEAGHITPADI